MKTIGRDFGDTARKVYAVASGALGNGKTCVVNSDGTVSVVGGATQAFGSEAVFESAYTSFTVAGYDPDANRIVIVYGDNPNSGYGTAVVGTVSSNSISFGTATVFKSAAVEHLAISYNAAAQKLVIAYSDNGDAAKGKCRVATVSNTSISFGTEVTWSTTTNSISISLCYDPDGEKTVLAFVNGSPGNGTAIVGTVSGTDISFGSATEFENSSSYYTSSVYDTNSNKVVIAYRNSANSSYGTAAVGTVSGTSISFGTPVVFEQATTNYVQAVFDSTNNKIVISYQDAGNSNYGTAIVGTVSGTSISFGTAVVFEAGNSDYLTSVYDDNANKVVVSYRDQGNSNHGTLAVGTVSGTSISFDTPVVFNASNTVYLGSAYNSSNNKVVIGFNDGGNSSYGTGIVFQLGFTNLTSENFIGITPSAYPTGAGAEIQTKGAVNEEQSGLTAGQSYYVQADGTLSTTAGDPSVFAGTAVSATKIIVKG